MKIRQIAAGIVSGYASKLVQLLASVAIVPFLLRSEVLGVEAYGRAFAILGATSLIGIATTGLHLSAERAISRAIGRGTGDSGPTVGEMLGSGTKVLSLVSLAFVLPLLVFGDGVIRSLGLTPDADHRLGLLAAVSIALFENAFYLFRAPLLARGDIAYVNLVGLFEIVARTALIFVLFSSVRGTVATFLGIQAAFTLLRQLLLLARLGRSDLTGFAGAPLASAMETVRYAGPVSLAEGAVILIRNLPVVLATRFLGPTEAGWVAVVSNTLQGYFLQIFYSVVQPIALPIASRFALDAVGTNRRRGFMELEAAYSLGVAIVFAQLIYWTPLVIPLWLGQDLAVIGFATQIMLAGTGIQTGAIIRRSVLIGQGHFAAAVPAIAGGAIVMSVAMAVGVAGTGSWRAAIACSAGFLVASGSLGVDRVFARRFAVDRSMDWLVRLASLSSIYVASMLVSPLAASRGMPSALGGAVVVVAISCGIGLAALISWVRLRDLGERLYRARGVDLFE